MKRAKTILPIFLLFVALSFFILLFIQTPLQQPLQSITLPIQKWVFTTYESVPLVNPVNESEVQKENNELRKQLAKTEELKRDNKALRDQFQTSNPAPRTLLPAVVVGVRDGTILIDKGEKDSIQIGDIVVLKDNLLGKVSKVSPHVAVVTLIIHPDTSFTAETSKTAAIGVIKANNGEGITLENVVLSNKLEKDDLVVTKGDVDEKGGGFPPDLVVGKIISVNKQASSLFQSAQIRSLVDINTVRMVFVAVN